MTTSLSGGGSTGGPEARWRGGHPKRGRFRLYVLNGSAPPSGKRRMVDALSTIVDDVICRAIQHRPRERCATSRSSWQRSTLRRAATSRKPCPSTPPTSGVGGCSDADLMQYVWDRALDRQAPPLGALRSHLPVQRTLRPLLSGSRRSRRDDHGRSQGCARSTGRGRHVVPDLQRRRVLLRKDFFELLAYARALQFDVKIKTNAFSSATRRRARSASSASARSQISIYSHRAEVHDAHHQGARLARPLAGRDPVPEGAGPSRDDRQRADAAERRRLSGRAALAARIGRRVHARPDHHAEDGWRHVDPRLRMPAPQAAPRLHRPIAGRRGLLPPRRLAFDPRCSTRFRAAPDIPPAMSPRTAIFTRACSFRCRPATCAGSGSRTSGGTRRSSRRSARSGSAICRPARSAASIRTAPDARASRTWRATCAGPRRPTARNRCFAPARRQRPLSAPVPRRRGIRSTNEFVQRAARDRRRNGGRVNRERRAYEKPAFVREQVFETMALAAGNQSDDGQCNAVKKAS